MLRNLIQHPRITHDFAYYRNESRVVAFVWSDFNLARIGIKGQLCLIVIS